MSHILIGGKGGGKDGQRCHPKAGPVGLPLFPGLALYPVLLPLPDPIWMAGLPSSPEGVVVKQLLPPHVHQPVCLENAQNPELGLEHEKPAGWAFSPWSVTVSPIRGERDAPCPLSFLLYFVSHSHCQTSGWAWFILRLSHQDHIWVNLGPGQTFQFHTFIPWFPNAIKWHITLFFSLCFSLSTHLFNGSKMSD